MTKSNDFLCIEDVFRYNKCKTQCDQCKKLEEQPNRLEDYK